MARIHYYFDTESSQYKRVQPQTSEVVFQIVGVGILSLGIAVLLMILYSINFESPRELKLGNEVREMEFYYDELNKKVESLKGEFVSIESRDANIYRTVLGAEPFSPEARQEVMHDFDTYKNFKDVDLVQGAFMVALTEKIDKLRKRLYLESISQDEIVQLSQNKETMSAAIPAIQPVSNKQLIAIASGFGLRIHPIYKVTRMHTGIDFAATTGTPIYATANGTVVTVDTKYDGYGKMVVIDHGFGYSTRYAHMQDFLVTVGQKVKRGQKIGYVGSTGVSTASHLHYEVLINGEQIDPVHYFFNDLSPLEYEKVVQLASVRNQSLGN
jgi:murein DD-endopeptidase MepM/ murein hydrolase activator NlpD